MNELPKVAVIEPVGGHSGMDYYDFGLCSGLAENGVNVTLYTCDETTIPKNIDYRICRFYQNIYGKDKAWVRGLRFVRGSITSMLDAKRKGVQIIHLHFFFRWANGIIECFTL